MSNLNKAIELYSQKKYQKAILHSKDIKSKKAYFIMAESLFELGKYQQAIPYYKCLLKNNIKDPWLANHLSQSYEKIGDYKNAIQAGFKSLELAPQDNAHHINFAYLLYDAKDKSAIQKWQTLYKDNSIATHFSNALLGNDNITDSNLEYIKDIFNSFGSSFDFVLNSLSYQAPAYIKDLFVEQGIKKADVLDLGCGTGLCGKLIKKYAKKNSFTGVDISSKMLDVAIKKNIYNHVVEDDIISYLQDNKTMYDCVVSSDVLTYFGDLEDLFLLTQKSLKEDGYFMFTVSKNTYNDSNVFLAPSARFLHSKNYIENVIKISGLKTLKIKEKVLRFEGEKNVFGYVVLAQKKAP